MPISPHATVADECEIPDSCFIGPGCVIGPHVVMGENCRLMAHVVVGGNTRLGAGNHIFPFTTVGVAPQDVSYQGEPTELVIGDNNVIREFCSLHRGTVKGRGVTSVGNSVLLMAYCHVAHDCEVGDHVIMANAATLGGHVTVGEWATIGAHSPVHQFVRVGAHAYIGGGTIVTQDVLPFSITSESRENHAFGVNRIGLERRGFSQERIEGLRQAFRLLLNSGLNTTQACDRIRQEVATPDTELLLEFIATSQRGVILR